MPLAQLPNLMPAAAELVLAIGAMALLLFGVFQRERDAKETAGVAAVVSRYSLLLLTLTIVAVVTMASRGAGKTFGGSFIVDDFAVFAKVVVLLASFAAIVIWEEYAAAHLIARFEYPVLILLATLGMLIMVSANDLMTLYLGLEMQSLALYVIAAFHRDDSRSVEAGLKYFVLGALASGMFLYGASLLYGFTGTTNFDGIAQVFTAAVTHGTATGVTVGLVFVIAGLAFKVSAVPFHMWTPDVYEGAPTPVTAFFSIAPKMAAVALLTRVLVGPLGPLAGQWVQIVVFLSMASMVLGGFAAIGQTNIKRLMAYSSIGHIGFALIGLAVAGEGLAKLPAAASPEQRAALLALATGGVQSVIVYMSIYLVMNLGVFCCILAMRRRNVWLVGIEDLAGLSRHHPVMAAALAVFMFSMAGIPPLAGFFGKLYIFLGAVDAGLYVLAIVGVLSSVVAAYYYVRIIKIMYFDTGGEAFDRDVAREIRWLTLVSMAVIVFFFLIPSTLLAPAATAARALMAAS